MTANPEVVELLQQLIRNGCVNDGTDGSGGESRNADALRAYLSAGRAPDHELVEPVAGRGSLIARIEGSDPSAPSLSLMGHTDVVPFNAETWQRDPLGGELVDGEVWGRGAVDMLNQTAAMAVAFKRLADSGFTPKGTLVFLAVADEEAGGVVGAKPLVEAHRDAVLTDYCLTEFGGFTTPAAGGGVHVSVGAAEKGGAAVKLTVKGRASHGSVPYGSDNALVTAAEVVRRISLARGPSRIDDTWRSWVDAKGYDDEMRATLLDPDRLWEAMPTMARSVAGHAHACTHLTAAPTLVTGAPQQKINVIPDVVRIGVDVRLLPGQGEDDVRAFLDGVIGDDLRDRVEIDLPRGARSGTSSTTDTPLWHSMTRAAQRAYPDAELLPSMASGTTDARWLRPAGVITYGFGLLSHKVTPADFWSRFHGKDERIDLESLDLSVELWEWLARDFLS
ncbi:MAG TPA: M20/M25/M40 family metallo-hydrolase [Acidimicrobiales bacterium]|nr:M20/M25/M40 family metallo-hydrolase [Acidimicrobiales bacterium]